MPDKIQLKNRMLRASGNFSSADVFLKNARVAEGLSRLTEIRVELLSDKEDIDLQDFIGNPMHIELEGENGNIEYYSGVCISVEYVGLYQGMLHLVAEVRPWLWYLTRSRDNRIYQEQTAPEIIKLILGDYGFSSDVTDSLQGTYEARTYCVQYGESDFDFISRLMEEEGIYYFFRQDDAREKLVLADGISAHKVVPDNANIEFHFREESYRRRNDHIFDWTDIARVTTGKVMLNDFNFETPKADLKSRKAVPKGTHSHKNYEHYDYPGHYRESGKGENFARVKMESEAVQHKISRGVGNVRGMRSGSTFALTGHTRTQCNDDYLVVSAVHVLQIETDYEDAESQARPNQEDPYVKDMSAFTNDTYVCKFEVIPKTEPFRAPQNTPWPEVAGLQTAIVTGPSGEEIHTDEYGRIKVQFHWDREGQNDEHTTCWVRCVMPWTGKNWGMISVPRIGQEVVIQFEEGDPDRPVCTGMLYNGDTKPPYALPANMTQTGIVTRSTKTGSASTYNELIFEDKKDAEFVRMQSEKDFFQTIKNNATVTIGVEKQDAGDLTQTIYGSKTETLNTGDHTFTVEEGHQTVAIKQNHTETIEGNAEQTIKGTSDQTITGDTTQTIEQGNLTRKVSSGNEAVTISMGDFTLDTSLGSVAITAMNEISLTVGGNSITIDQSGITISGIMVTVEGQATVDVGSPMTTVSGDGMLTLDGGVTMIN